MKYLKTRRYAIYVIVLIVWAFCLRIFLAASSWPLLNSDEGVIGIMALHILRGARPIFFYGQYYMGALQAYVAALLFPVFGANLFSLRLAIILFYGAFLVAMYALTQMLYSKYFALFVLFLLSLGSNAVFSRQLSAIGGYSETVFFSALAFVLVAWLALSAPDGTTRHRLLRLCAYSVWGLTLGLGLWSDLLILPTIACSGLLLGLFCWRELLKGFIIPLLLCLVLGALPLIVYNLHAVPGLDSWSTLMALQGHVDHTVQTLIEQINATTDYGIPAITGNPLCHHSEFEFLHYFGFQASHPMDQFCTIQRNLWSGAYLSLFVLACLMVAFWLFVVLRSHFQRPWTLQGHHLFVRNAIRFSILVSTFLTLYLYTTSGATLVWPSVSSRYLICLWVSTPVVLWPLWKGMTWVGKQSFPEAIHRIVVAERAFCFSALVCLCVALLYGTYVTISEIPAAVRASRVEYTVIDTLIKNKITHVYSGYWTCNRIAFESQERITCGVLNKDLTSPGLNKYLPYYTIVQNDPHTAYIFELNNDFLYYQLSDLATIESKLALTGKKYRRLMIEDYVVYEPVP